MRRTPALYLFLVALVFLSGCNVFGGGNNVKTTVTPADVPTDKSTPIPTLAPGLTKYGVVNSTALNNAHNAALSNTSYTVLVTTTERYTNGSPRARRMTRTRVVEPVGRYYSIMEWEGPSQVFATNSTYYHIEWWSNGERLLIARTVGNNSTYMKSSQPSRRWPDFSNSNDRFYFLFQAVDTRVVGKETLNGTMLYRIESTEVLHPYLVVGGMAGVYDDPRNITFQALIDSRGIVPEYRIAYTATDTATNTNENITIRIVRTVRYTEIGSTTVERPSWYETANQSTTPTPSRSH
jgi:hypothetical protein